MTPSRPVRVLVAIKGMGIGGAERLIAEGARYWDRERFEYQVTYALAWKDQLLPGLEKLRVPFRCFGDVFGSLPSWLGFRRVVGAFRPDLIHVHSPTVGVVARLSTRRPVVYTEHNLADSYHPMTRLANRLTFGCNDAVIAVSDAVAASLATYPGPQPIVIPNAVNSGFDGVPGELVRHELAIAGSTPMVVHVGNVRPGKGHEVLLKAVLHLRRLVPEAVVVSIGGEKFPGDLGRLRARAQQLGLGDSIRFLGRREDAMSFIAAADAYVSPGEVEGLPVSLLEAMVLGRPVIATAVGGVPDLIRHEHNGLLVDPHDPAALAEATSRVLLDRDFAKSLGSTAQALVREAHGLEPMIRRVEAVYEQVVVR